MQDKVSIVWFRRDLRISDNPAFSSGVKLGKILPIYIFDDCFPENFKIGAVSKLWLHHSLGKLNLSLNGNLNFYIGNAKDVINSLIQNYNVSNIFWNECYEKWNLNQSSDVISLCKNTNTEFEVFNSNYLWGPSDILKDDGSYYKVFTAYKKKSYLLTPRRPVQAPKNFDSIKDNLYSVSIDDFKLIPEKKWHHSIEKFWNVGEGEAQKKLNIFIRDKLNGYKEGRNYPSQDQVSLLSPHLHFGEISPAQIWHKINNFASSHALYSDIEHFLSEVIWREFSYYLMFHFKSLHEDNFNNKFDKFPWKDDDSLLRSWQKGQTGYPIVDAGMRQLWQTGYMHNRVRMIVASFLVKNLNIHWHKGRDWFWGCLIDADLANNSASWQWVAGCGADAAPYFRIFNPVTQGEKFDKSGDYTRKYVPELQNLPDKYLFKPWEAPEYVLKSAGVELGFNYPKPIIDLQSSRNRALENYKNLG